MAAADAPGYFMRDRVNKLASQRGAWLKQVQELSKGAGQEVSRRKTASQHLAEAAAIEQNPPLKGALSAYSAALLSSANTMEDLYSEHVDKRVQLPLQAYDKICITPMNAVLADRDAAFSDARKAVEAHNAARLKNAAPGKLSESETKAMTTKRRAHNTHVLFEEASQLFEYKRVADMKKWLQHEIMAEIAFHSACMETLTQALQVVAQVDPDAAMDSVRDQLVHPSVTATEYSQAASGSSQPFVGMYVAPDLQSVAAGAVGLTPTNTVALAGASNTSEATPMPIPTPSATMIVPEEATSPKDPPSDTAQESAVSSSSSNVHRADRPPSDTSAVSSSASNVHRADRVEPGAAQALRSLPTPRPAMP